VDDGAFDAGDDGGNDVLDVELAGPAAAGVALDRLVLLDEVVRRLAIAAAPLVEPAQALVECPVRRTL
jgi:hypothetical protein